VLFKWKSDLEAKLAEIEEQISALESERRRVREQLGAMSTLLSTTEGREVIESGSSNMGLTEVDAIADFLSSLKGKGWSITRRSGRLNSYRVSRGGQTATLWIKFSMYHQAVDSYWFGIGPENLESLTNEGGGVILLLGTSDRYLCFPFTQLQELLRGATKAKTGQKFKVRERKGQIQLQPAGTGEWIDVSSFFSSGDLRKIELAD